MPLPKDMKKCMSKVKKEFPEGRSDKKMSKKKAHKQHVAMCLNAESFSFKDFLLIETEESKLQIKSAIEHLTSMGMPITYETVAKTMAVDPAIVERVVKVLSVDDPDLIRVFHQR